MKTSKSSVRPGKKPLQIWFTDADFERLRRAAASDRRPMATFVRLLIEDHVLGKK